MQSLLYPVDWPQLAFEIKEANDWRCQACGEQCRRPGEAFDTHARTLAVAHLTQDYSADWVQLAPLCMTCHLRYDARHSGIARLRNLYLRRRIAGQLELFASLRAR